LQENPFNRKAKNSVIVPETKKQEEPKTEEKEQVTEQESEKKE
jgi:hypothetical protein